MGDLELGLALVETPGAPPTEGLELALEAERLGFHSVWCSEAWGRESISTLTWMGARTSRIGLGTGVVPISARTPAATAMTVATMDHLTEGRVLLGLGVSGPQVVEGWYGQPFDHPLDRMREYVGIVRQALAGERVASSGPHYPLPLPGSSIGKPLRLGIERRRSEVPILIGAEGPRNVEMAVDIADGWLPMLVGPSALEGLYSSALAAARPSFLVAPTVTVSIDEDLTTAREPIRRYLAFYAGGMGAKGANFHHDHLGRLGYAEAAEKVQDLYLAGNRAAACAAVPDSLVDEVALCGPPGRIHEQLDRWAESAAGLLIARTGNAADLDVLASWFG